jgi:hypothetical protein
MTKNGNGLNHPQMMGQPIVADIFEQMAEQMAEMNRKISGLELAIRGHAARHDQTPVVEDHASVVVVEDQAAVVEDQAAVVVRPDSPFYGFPRAAEAFRVYTNKKRRSLIGASIRKRGGRDIWELILAAIDAGLLTPTDAGGGGHLQEKLSIKVALFPWLPVSPLSKRYDLRNPRDREAVRDLVLPVAIANKDEVMANPDILEQLVYNERQQRAQEKQTEQALANLGPGESPIIIYGKIMWPRPNNKVGEYSFDQACAAARSFRDLDKYMKGSAQSKAIQIRNSTKWLRRHCASVISCPTERSNIERVYALIHGMATFLEESPDGECRWPPTIHME